MQTLLLLLKHAEHDRDAALASAQLAQRAHDNAAAQRQQLVDYRTDYETRWSAQFSAGADMSLMRCYHDFMGRLTQAVEQQQRAVDHAAAQHDAARGILRERELRVASVGKLIERRSREIRIGAERREQKQFDEMAAHLMRIKPVGLDLVSER